MAFRAGALGLFVVGALDSSILMLPLGNDLLLMALVARHHTYLPLYVLSATLGSLVGVALTVWLSRKGGDKLLEKVGKRKRRSFEKGLETHAGWVLGIASLLPPPFPFTTLVAAASALKTPQSKLFLAVGSGRLVRFTIEAALALYYGRWIISAAQSPAFRHFGIFLLVVAVLGTGYSIYRWTRR